MITNEKRDYLCCEVINSYLFANVWNDPFKEFRVNIRPAKIKSSASVGSISLVDGTLKLPTNTDRYYVYAVSTNNLPVGREIEIGKWISCTELCNDYHVMFHMHTDTGHMMHKGSSYVYLNQSRSFMFVAVNEKVFKQCCPKSKISDLVIAIYYDSSVADPVDMLSITVSDINKLAEYTNRISNFLKNVTDLNWITVYRNGEEVTNGSTIPVLKSKDVLDVIIDRNVVARFDIPLEFDSEEYPSATYFSTRDKMYKYIIHTPKAFNPDNLVYTHNTCDYFIRRRDSNHGLFLHRLAEKGITQITHNDVGLPLYIVDAYRDYLEYQTVDLRVVVRKHNNNNVLIRDASYIDLLYCDKHDDADIVRILAGNGPSTIPWWKADNLEQSQYLAMMFDAPNTVTVDNMQQYVDALGYYHTAELLCHRILDAYITDATTHTFKFDLPVMYIGRDIFPLMYLGGKYLNSKYYTYEMSGDSVTVELDSSIVTSPGQKLTIVFYMSGEERTFSKVISAGDNSINIPYEDPLVYVEAGGSKRSVMEVYKHGYLQLQPGTNQYVVTKNEDGTFKVTLSAEYLGKEVVVQNAYCTYVRTVDLSKFTERGDPISISLKAMTSDDVEIPILAYRNMSVYLNGNYLVKGLDYSVYFVHDESGQYIYGLELIIQTMDHFNLDAPDVLDVIINIAEGVDTSIGFVQDDKVSDATPVNLYFPSMTLLHVDGKLERDGVNHSTYVELPKGKYQYGSKFELETAIPVVISEYIHEHAEEDDAARLAAINEYFVGYSDINEPDLVVLEGTKHRIYSVYMSTFICDVIDNKVGIAEESDPERMHNYIADYDYLKEVDVVYSGLDTRFVEYYPHYANFDVDSNTRRMLQKYANVFMPENRDPSLEVTY